MNERDRRRLNAPEGFPWADEDVIFEKNDSLLTGIIIGVILAVIVFGLLWLLAY